MLGYSANTSSSWLTFLELLTKIESIEQGSSPGVAHTRDYRVEEAAIGAAWRQYGLSFQFSFVQQVKAVVTYNCFDRACVDFSCALLTLNSDDMVARYSFAGFEGACEGLGAVAE